jgi:hypothetical protein
MEAHLESAVGEKWGHSVRCREAFHGLGVQDVTGFDSVCSLSSACWENEMKRKKKKKKGKKSGQGLFLPCLEPPSGFAGWDFCGC